MTDYVAIDFETANEKRSSACALGVTTVQNRKIIASFSRLIRPPDLRFCARNTKIHGLTEKDVQDAPTLAELWPEILPLLENHFVVSHNASFDLSVLKNSLNAVSLPFPRIKCVCTLEISRRVWPRLASHSLSYVADSLGIPLVHHEPGGDSRASAAIVLRALEETETPSIIALAGELGLRIRDLDSIGKSPIRMVMSSCNCRDSVTLQMPEMCDIATHEFFGRTIAITGKLELFTREEAFHLIELFGGVPADSVTKDTDFLIVGLQDEKKTEKRRDGILEAETREKAPRKGLQYPDYFGTRVL